MDSARMEKEQEEEAGPQVSAEAGQPLSHPTSGASAPSEEGSRAVRPKQQSTLSTLSVLFKSSGAKCDDKHTF